MAPEMKNQAANLVGTCESDKKYKKQFPTPPPQQFCYFKVKINVTI
jgi:hypothetical protein